MREGPESSMSEPDGGQGLAVEQPVEDNREAEAVAAPHRVASGNLSNIEQAGVWGSNELTGKTLGHYAVEAYLGGGAMAAVYRARDLILERTVALKVLLPGADAVARERFRREARTLSQLEHPNIVKTYQVGQTAAAGVIYIAMELVSGMSLSELLEQKGKLSANDTCALLAPIARALDYAHACGVVHRDVKPSNILLRTTRPGAPHSVRIAVLDQPVAPLLSDFGIARALDSPDLTSAGRTIGTPAFMSPEQCAGNAEIDGRADLYSLGAVAYRCLVGRTPFTGTTTQILHAHVYDPLLIPDAVMRELPAIMVEVLRRALMKDPGERYQAAQLMAQDMEAVEGSLPPASEATLHGDAEPTKTIEVVPTWETPGLQPAATVLVPGGAAAPKRTRPGPLAGGPAGSPAALKKTLRAPMRPIKAIRPRNRTGLYIISAALVALLVMLALTVIYSVLPTLAPDPNSGARNAAQASSAAAQVASQRLSSPRRPQQTACVRRPQQMSRRLRRQLAQSRLPPR